MVSILVKTGDFRRFWRRQSRRLGDGTGDFALDSQNIGKNGWHAKNQLSNSKINFWPILRQFQAYRPVTGRNREWKMGTSTSKG